MRNGTKKGEDRRQEPLFWKRTCLAQDRRVSILEGRVEQ